MIMIKIAIILKIKWRPEYENNQNLKTVFIFKKNLTHKSDFKIIIITTNLPIVKKTEKKFFSRNF